MINQNIVKASIALSGAMITGISGLYLMVSNSLSQTTLYTKSETISMLIPVAILYFVFVLICLNIPYVFLAKQNILYSIIIPVLTTVIVATIIALNSNTEGAFQIIFISLFLGNIATSIFLNLKNKNQKNT